MSTVCFKVDSIENGAVTFSVYNYPINPTLELTTTTAAGSSTSSVDMSCLADMIDEKTVPVYQGATVSAAGVTGTVPPATSAEKDSFLKGDGTWGIPPTTPIYQGATAQAAGITGTVPAATSVQKDKFLQGDGTWEPALVDVDGEVVQSQGVHPVINNVQYLSAEATLTFNVYDTQYDYDFDQPETLEVGCSSCSGFVSGTEQLITQDDATSRIVGTWGGPNIQLTASDTISFYGSLSVGGYDPILLVFIDAEQETTYGIYAPAITSVVLPVGATYTVQATLVTISGVTTSPEPIEDHPEVGTWTFSFVRDSAYAISSYVLWTSPNDVAAGEAIRLTGTMSDSTTVTHDVMLPAVVHINGAETINGVKTFNAGYFGNVEALTEDQNNPGEYPVDVSHATSFTLTLDDDAEFVFSGVPANRSACFFLKLDNGGDYTVTWPSSVLWCNDTEPELTSGGTDILTFITFNGGTNWYGTLSMTQIGLAR